MGVQTQMRTAIIDLDNARPRRTWSRGHTMGVQIADADGISDPNDQCPDEFGFERYNGCPDFGSLNRTSNSSKLFRNHSFK